jgi:hypothetical protein
MDTLNALVNFLDSYYFFFLYSLGYTLCKAYQVIKEENKESSSEVSLYNREMEKLAQKMGINE